MQVYIWNNKTRYNNLPTISANNLHMSTELFEILLFEIFQNNEKNQIYYLYQLFDFLEKFNVVLNLRNFQRKYEVDQSSF